MTPRVAPGILEASVSPGVVEVDYPRQRKGISPGRLRKEEEAAMHARRFVLGLALGAAAFVLYGRAGYR